MRYDGIRGRKEVNHKLACNYLCVANQSRNLYTASFAFFESLWEAGITHCFVNLGSDHPSIIEAIVKGQNEKKGQFPRIITCPNEVSVYSTKLLSSCVQPCASQPRGELQRTAANNATDGCALLR